MELKPKFDIGDALTYNQQTFTIKKQLWSISFSKKKEQWFYLAEELDRPVWVSEESLVGQNR